MNFYNFSFSPFALCNDNVEPFELPLKFNDIVDMYYDKMRPPKNKGIVKLNLKESIKPRVNSNTRNNIFFILTLTQQIIFYIYF